MAKKHAPGFLALVEATKGEIEEITPQEVYRRRMNDIPLELIDTREDHEFMVDHCQGAVHISKGIIERDIEKLYPDLNTPLVLYCGGGYRSALAAQALQKMGYTQVLSMAGGIRTWRELELPIISSHGVD